MNSPHRVEWIRALQRIAQPVLNAASSGKLRALMPVESRPGQEQNRRLFSHLEAVARTLVGIAPWLEQDATDPAEKGLQTDYREKARAAIAAVVDPDSPDYADFVTGGQPLVEAAFLSQAMLRAPTQLAKLLPDRVRQQFITEMKRSRQTRPGFNNWLLFSASVEAALHHLGQPDWDRMRVDYALRQHEQWYKGDGVYGDGPNFHWDYYNAFVIQPMMLDILREVGQTFDEWKNLIERTHKRATRYAAVQERLISPEGTFPPIGRSLCYRFGSLQALSHATLHDMLPKEVSPTQVRCALSAVIKRQIEMPGTFDANGWLTLGFAGHQPDIAESYISTGSTYLCTAVFLPLGLPATHAFWSGADEMWTSQKIWAGQDAPADHALYDA